MTDPKTVEEFADVLALLCDEGADIILNRMGPASDDSAATDDKKAWEADFHSDLPFRWVNEIAGVYLTESAHLIQAIAPLFRSRTVYVSLDPLVRAVVERVGRVNWVPDHRITAHQRAIRSGLEVAVSWQFYRAGLARLNADRDVRRLFRSTAKEHLRQMNDWFTITKPLDEPCDPKEDPSDATEEAKAEGWEKRMVPPPSVTAFTPLGKLHRVAPVVRMSATPPYWADPLLVPRGSAPPEWGSRG